MARARPFLLAALIVASVVAVYRQVAHHPFVVWDDHAFLFNNSDLKPPTLHRTMLYWATTPDELFMPVTYSVWAGLASFAYEPAQGGLPATLDAAPFHIAGIVTHALAAVMVFVVLRQLVRRDLPAMVGAMLFALHPIQVEAVAWASELKDLLAALLGLCALSLYIALARRSAEGTPCAPTRQQEVATRAALYIYATLCFALAVMAKPSAIALPLVAAAIDRILIGRRWRSVLLVLVPWGLVLVVAAVIAMGAQQAKTVDSPLWARPIVAIDALSFYLTKLVVPLDLCADYGRSPQWLLNSSQVLFTWTVLAGAAIACWVERRRNRWLTAALGCFAGALLPTLGLVPFSFQEMTTVTDHYAYLAMFGAALAAAMLVARLGRAGIVGSVAVLLVLGVLSHRQTFIWRDTATLFTHTLRVNPRSAPANWHFAQKCLANDDWGGALAHLEHCAVRKQPVVYRLIAEIHMHAGRWDAAVVALELLLAAEPREREVRDLLPVVRGAAPDAAARRAELLSRRTWAAQVLAGDGWFAILLRQYCLAVERYEGAIRLDPSLAGQMPHFAVARERCGRPGTTVPSRPAGDGP